MITKTFLFFQVIIFISINLVSQVSQEWSVRYNGFGNGNDEANKIAIDRFGNILVTGESYGSGPGYDYVTIKYSSSGDTLWVRRFNGLGNNNDVAESIAIDDSGNVYVTGTSVQSVSDRNFLTIKYDSSGIQLWTASYDGPANQFDEASSIALDYNGNVYVTGQSTGIGTGYDYATVKYNSAGTQLWVQRYHGGYGYDVPCSIIVDDLGYIYVTGTSIGNGTNQDYATIKYSSSGVQQWVKRYDGVQNYYDYAASMVIDDSNNVYVTGRSQSSSYIFTSDYATVKYSSSGVQQWEARYDGTLMDVSTAITVDHSANVYVTGSSYSSTTYSNYCTIKYNSSGIQQWLRTYNLTGQDFAYSIAIDKSDNIYVTGNSSDDIATIKYNPSGILQWEISYNGPGNGIDEASSIIVDSLLNVYVTGFCTGSGSFRDYVTIKYSQVVGIRSIVNETPNNFHIFQNYPNPFNPVTKIKFDIPQDSRLFAPACSRQGNDNVSLKIYDVLGREIATLVNKHLNPGTYQTKWDGTNHPSGVYFYKLITGDYTETRKMVLIK